MSVRLRAAGCPSRRAAELVSAWIREEDFLRARIDEPFDAVVGNPPYIRYDAIRESDAAEYERLYTTFRGRCDLYVPFVERSLSLLSPDGVFCFICSNRFAKSDYGKRLRTHIAAGFRVALFLDSAPGTRFGIGVATGNDAVFVRPGPEPGVEPDCLLPLVTGDDVRAGVRWGGSYLVNPFRPDASGMVRDLSERPGLRRYLEQNRPVLSSRFVAKRKEWYRTIDRVNWTLFKTPKILLPDIQRGGVVGLDRNGSIYPHHNLYWITSEGWPLDLLAAILKSGFVTRQIRWSSCEMRGGSIRYQAKNLDRLRLPPRTAVTAVEGRRLVAASENDDTATLSRLVDSIVERCLRDGGCSPVEQPEQLLLAMESPPGFAGFRSKPKTKPADKQRRFSRSTDKAGMSRRASGKARIRQ